MGLEHTTRREFLKTASLAGASLFMPSFLEAAGEPVQSKQDEAKFDISYFWDKNIEKVLDYSEKIAEQLGPEVAKKLRIVKGKKNFGLVYDRNGDSKSS